LKIKDSRRIGWILERAVLAIFSTVSTELVPNWAGLGQVKP
jgi:hypothetical protein